MYKALYESRPGFGFGALLVCTIEEFTKEIEIDGTLKRKFSYFPGDND